MSYVGDNIYFILIIYKKNLNLQKCLLYLYFRKSENFNFTKALQTIKS